MDTGAPGSGGYAKHAALLREGIVIRRLGIRQLRTAVSVAAALGFALQICPVVRCQDAPPPSLGDVAPKYR